MLREELMRSYFLIRLFQEGFWRHTSMASLLGKSVFLMTLFKEQKYSVTEIPINHCKQRG